MTLCRRCTPCQSISYNSIECCSSKSALPLKSCCNSHPKHFAAPVLCARRVTEHGSFNIIANVQCCCTCYLGPLKALKVVPQSALKENPWLLRSSISATRRCGPKPVELVLSHSVPFVCNENESTAFGTYAFSQTE